jgi:anaerobic ribonucleoside-triphosphate reductase activating protein
MMKYNFPNNSKPFLRLYAYLPKTRALGPYTRFALWVQGCPRRCPGCMTPAARDLTAGTKFMIDELTELILSVYGIEGLTISGGEPFLQAGSLIELLSCLKHKKDLGLIVYSGYTLQELRNQEDSTLPAESKDLLALTDILIDGPYIRELDDGYALRGSANQRIYCLNSRYKKNMAEYNRPRREIEMHLLHDELVLAGIPGKQALKIWQEKLRE